MVANLGLALFTRRPLVVTYFLPLYAVFPIWAGECLAWLWGVRRWLGATLVAGLLAFHLWANWAVTLGRGSEPTPRWSGLRAAARPLTEWLTARGIRHVYWALGSPLQSYEFTYLTGMRVIAADLWGEPVVPHGQVVDADTAPVIVTTDDLVQELRPSLEGLALSLRETRVGSFIVLEVDPRPAMAFAPLPPEGWTVTTSSRPQDARYPADRDAGTGWSTGQRQSPGQWIAIDLGREEEVARIDLLAIDWKEVPSAFQVEWSRDGDTWDTAVSVPRYRGPLFVSEWHPFLRVRRGRVQAVFAPVRARFLRFVQLGESPHAWAARELFVYRPVTPDPAAPVAPGPGELAAALRGAGVSFVYASHWLSARVLADRGGVGALDSNLHWNSYGRADPEPTLLQRFRLEAGRGVLLGRDADEAGIRRLLGAQGIAVRESTVGPHRLFHLAPGARRRPLVREGWRATASTASAEALRVVDGDRRTRWTSGGPVSSVAHVTVDLGRLRRVTGLRLVPGSREGGPAELDLEGSVDGLAWARLRPLTWVGPLYWTGYELLRNSRREWAVTFAPAMLRHLRIRPATAAPTWGIEEIDIFE